MFVHSVGIYNLTRLTLNVTSTTLILYCDNGGVTL